jgi:TetR/AcrR family transcriptional repressor of nem operon
MARTKAFDQTEVLKKIQKLFWDKGFNGTSVDDLVNASGLSRSSLYDTFGDKEALFIASLRLYRQENTRQMVDMIEQSTDVRKTVAEIFDYILEDSRDNQRLGCLMVNTAIELAAHEKKIAKAVDENMVVIHEAMVRLIRRSQAKGELRKTHSPEALSTMVLTSVNGLRVAEKWGTEEKTYKRVKEMVLSLFD